MKTFLLEKFQPSAILICFSASMVCALACHDQPKKITQSAAMPQKGITTKKFTADMVDNKTDPNCGMPVTAGIADTVRYHGKIYGFCSAECKQAFLKNPEALVKNAQLK